MSNSNPQVLHHDLARRVSSSAWTHAQETLKQFSVAKLREYKIVTRSFARGLVYSDPYTTRQSNVLLLKKLAAKASVRLKEQSETHAEYPFMRIHEAHIWLHFTVMRDPSVVRYCNMLATKLTELGAPFTVTQANDTHPLLMNVYFQSTPSNPNAQNYRILFALPDILQAIKTLSRKAYFTNDSLLTANRSKRAIVQDRQAAQSRAASQGSATQSTNPTN